MPSKKGPRNRHSEGSQRSCPARSPGPDAGAPIGALPARAAETLSLLLLVVAVSSLALAPQASEALGIEVITCAGLMSLVVLLVQLRHGPDDPADPAWWFVSRIANAQLPTLLFLAGGITLTVRYGYGLYFMLAGTLTAFLGAVYNAWVLGWPASREQPRDKRPS